MPKSLVIIDRNKGGLLDVWGFQIHARLSEMRERTEAGKDRLTERWDDVKRLFRIQIVGWNGKIIGSQGFVKCLEDARKSSKD